MRSYEFIENAPCVLDDVEIISTLGINCGFVWCDEIKPKDIKSIGELLNLAEKLHIKQLWILPGCKVFNYFKRYHKKVMRERGEWKVKPDTLNNLITGWREGINNSRVQIIFPNIVTDQWELTGINTALDLFQLIERLQAKLNVPVTLPVRTGRALALASMNRKLEPVQSDLSIFREHIEQDYIWRREPDERERACKFLHVYDKRKMYFTASNIPLGCNSYEHITDAKWNYWKEIKDNRAGLFRVKQVTGIHKDLIPYFNQGEWMYTPLVRQLQPLALSLEISEACLFTSTNRHLEGFYNVMRGALAAAPKGSPDEAWLKNIYTQFFGWMLHQPTNGRAEILYRPDWRNMIVSEAKARLLINILAVHKALNMLPVGVRVDALFYFSDVPDASTAVPLGSQFKSYTVDAATALPMFDAGDSIAKIDNTLQRMVRDAEM